MAYHASDPQQASPKQQQLHRDPTEEDSPSTPNTQDSSPPTASPAPLSKCEPASSELPPPKPRSSKDSSRGNSSTGRALGPGPGSTPDSDTIQKQQQQQSQHPQLQQGKGGPDSDTSKRQSQHPQLQRREGAFPQPARKALSPALYAQGLGSRLAGVKWCALLDKSFFASMLRLKRNIL